MGEAEAMENFRVHERVGTLEQKVHTLEHRANSIEWIKPEVTKHATLLSEMAANHKALEKSVSELGDDFEEMNEKLDSIIGIHQEYRTSQMRELHEMRSEQSQAIGQLAKQQDRLSTQLGTLVKIVVLVGVVLAILVNLGKLSEVFGAKGYPKTVPGQHVPAVNYGEERVLLQAPGAGNRVEQSCQGFQCSAGLWSQVAGVAGQGHAAG